MIINNMHVMFCHHSVEEDLVTPKKEPGQSSQAHDLEAESERGKSKEFPFSMIISIAGVISITVVEKKK